MLPTTGHFKVISCPFFDACICERPYCHFKHSKKETGKNDDQVISELVSQAVHKVLNPEVSEVSKAIEVENGQPSECDIQAVVDTRKITYNPTPISELNKIRNGNNVIAEEKKSRRHIPIQYTPQRPQTTRQNDSPVYGETKSQTKTYSPTCKYSSEEVNYIPSSIKSLLSENSYDEVKTESYVPITSGISEKSATVSYNPTVIPQIEEAKNEINSGISNIEYVPSWINEKEHNDADDDDDGEDFLDDFLNDPNLYEPTEINNGIEEEDTSKNKVDLIKESCDNKIVTKTNVNSTVECDSGIENGKKYDKSEKVKESDKNASEKNSEGSNKKSSNNVDSKHRTKVKSVKRDSSNNVKGSEIISKKIRSTDSKSKSKQTEEKVVKESKNVKLKNVKSDKHKHDSKHLKSRDREKSSDKPVKKSSEKSKDIKPKEKKEHKSTHSKRSHKDKERHSSKSSSQSSSKTSSKTKAPLTQISPSAINVTLTQAQETANAGFSLSAEEIGMLDDDDLSGFDSDDPSSALEECKRIFEEYRPPEKVEKATVVQKPAEVDTQISRKRVAHESTSIFKVSAKQIPSRKRVETPAQMMARRYQLSRQSAANLKSISDSHSDLGINAAMASELGKRVPPLPSEAPSTSGIKRIARVPNVTSLINAKKRVEELMKEKLKNAQKTPCQTVPKGAKRVPHIPEASLFDTPMVLQADKSKLPINVRSKYLQMMAKECAKLYANKESIYERALNEELNCYMRCSVISTYCNSAMLAVNRLRKEHEMAFISNYAAPNLSIRGRKSSDNALELVGQRFYDNIYRWILTEEELESNGFPILGAQEKGHALFKDGKTFEVLAQNMHRCTRCKKLFSTDDDGFALNLEDCVYHPNGRFIYRGESKYICCRAPVSADGCCTANTHVFEICDPSKLGGFVTTLEPDGPNDSRSNRICALDCEMVYTTQGVELARVTVVDTKCETIYETMVKPFGFILDYNTRFSGITEDMLENVTKRLIDVQAAMLHMFNSKTILIGHSLESDLKALRIIHSTVIDTSVLFPHKQGPPKKRALRGLASDILQKIIQNSESGHDSAEDAITCMELINWKLKEELKTR